MKRIIHHNFRDGNRMGTGLVMALRPPFKRSNTSLRRSGSQRYSRRPTSLLAPPDVVPQSDQNGAKYGNTEGPASWACSFEKLLDDSMGLHVFAEFLKKEFSAENIFFWTACERYKNLVNDSDKAAEAQRIYQQHLSIGAPEAVNVDAQGRQCTEQCLQEPTNDIFDQAQKQIFNLMKFDSYPRFLKSEIYKQCLAGDFQKPPTDPRLLLNPTCSTPSKLKKSVSNAEDRRRKSLLPWHRKNRSKSKDRGELEYAQKHSDLAIDRDCNGKLNAKNEIHSSGSSLTSLDLATAYQETLRQKLNNNEDFNLIGERTSLCKVLLSNQSTTVVQIKDTETIQELVNRVLEKRGLIYKCFEVYTDKHSKALDITDTSIKLAGCEVTVEQRVIFKVDLPNRKTISIKSKYTKKIIDVLRPSLHKYQFNIDQVLVLGGNKPIDLHLPVTSIDGMRLNVQLKEDIRHDDGSRKDNKNSKRDELTNRVFEGILQEKANAVIFKHTKSDKESVKSEDWGSEHSSTFIGKFLRRDSGIHEKKKKIVQRVKVSNSEDVNLSQIKKPLIAKWKTGANKLNISCIENDELVEGLTRAQRRLEDQRGTEINFELPDFLKDKENQQAFNTQQKQSGSRSETRFYFEDTPVVHSKQEIYPPSSTSYTKTDLHSVYENRSITVPGEQSQTSPLKNSFNVPSLSDNTSAQNTPMKSSNSTELENKIQGRHSDPPPLPPKPKIVPIKPPNWGQLNGYKFKDIKTTNRNQTMFLEQPSSSFV